MKIDVTAADPYYSGPGSNTWSEKFDNVSTVEENSSGSLVVVSKGAGTEKVDRDGKGYIVVRGGSEDDAASFAPGAWHSWRQVKD